MKKVSENLINNDLETMEMVDKLISLIDKGHKDGLIPQGWVDKHRYKFEAIQEGLLEKHSEEYSEAVYEEIRRTVINFEKAINKSRV